MLEQWNRFSVNADSNLFKVARTEMWYLVRGSFTQRYTYKEWGFIERKVALKEMGGLKSGVPRKEALEDG